MWGRRFNYAAIENYACHECCGWIVRGQSATQHLSEGAEHLA